MKSDASIGDRLFAGVQYVLPHLVICGFMRALARCRWYFVKTPFISLFIRKYGVDMSQALHQTPDQFAHFSAFFTRELKPGARPTCEQAENITSPADGAISQLGNIDDTRVFQAKGRHFDLFELLGGSKKRMEPFVNGEFTTIYLSPKDYHRVHMPIDGRLRETIHIPGRLFSVNPATARAIPRLFARNERLVTIWDTDIGPVALIMVGALIVGSIETIWSGVVTPPRSPWMQYQKFTDANPVELKKGDEMGRFDLGSTVVMLFGKDKMKWAEGLEAESPLRMGQLLGMK